MRSEVANHTCRECLTGLGYSDESSGANPRRRHGHVERETTGWEVSSGLDPEPFVDPESPAFV